MTSRRSLLTFALLIAFASIVAGCGKKDDQSANTASSDSLLATNPIEQPEGTIEPQATAPPEAAPTQTPPVETPKPAAKPKPAPKPAPATATVPGGTAVKVTMEIALTTETAKEGEPFTGTVKEAVTIGSAAPIPAGSVVHGVVAGVKGAEKGDRAFFLLRVTSIEANGATHEVGMTADSMIAGSTRKRNVGAIAGTAAAGALLGKAIGGTGKSAVIGGLIGGAAATGVVATSKGFQVEVKPGQEVVFHVDRDTKIRL